METDVALALALRRIDELESLHEENAKKIEELEGWKNGCTRWAAWWAGVCAAVMTGAALLRTYWDEITRFFKSQL